jgi:hypothetical protein
VSNRKRHRVKGAFYDWGLLIVVHLTYVCECELHVIGVVWTGR